MKTRLLLITSFLLSSTFLLFAQTTLPTQTNTLFSGSGNCIMCHDNLVDSQGNNLGVVEDWRSTMMANSSKDPYWRAKVEHEIAVNPGLEAALEDKCTQCHAPAAHYDAHYNGQSYTLAELDTDPLARDGVNCTVCHQIPVESLGRHSGDFLINDQHQIYGPFDNPFATPMINNSGYTPVYSTHIKDSRICASCHTLITHSVDYTGTPTGNDFVEQSVYQEWLNSDYAANGVSCQACHVPEINEEVIISTMPAWLNTGRMPFGKHFFVGGNVFMLKLLKQFSEVLGITADPAQLDSTIALSQALLQEQTLDLNLELQDQSADSLSVQLELINKAGHKFPSGFPSRRVYVEFIALNQQGDTLFHSGAIDSEYRILGEDSLYEPHYDRISSEDQVQIYEMVMGDYLGNPTTVLLYADQALKDNRLPPAGFVTSHASYDTTAFQGAVLNDLNFNWKDGFEGSGTDRIVYQLALGEFTETVFVEARVWYQPTHAKWLDEMFGHTGASIDSFRSYYDASDKQAVLVASANLEAGIQSAESYNSLQLSYFPNPARDHVSIQAPSRIEEVRIFSQQGSQVYACSTVGANSYHFQNDLHLQGIYIFEIRTHGAVFREKVLFIR